MDAAKLARGLVRDDQEPGCRAGRNLRALRSPAVFAAAIRARGSSHCGQYGIHLADATPRLQFAAEFDESMHHGDIVDAGIRGPDAFAAPTPT